MQLLLSRLRAGEDPGREVILARHEGADGSRHSTYRYDTVPNDEVAALFARWETRLCCAVPDSSGAGAVASLHTNHATQRGSLEWPVLDQWRELLLPVRGSTFRTRWRVCNLLHKAHMVEHYYQSASIR